MKWVTPLITTTKNMTTIIFKKLKMGIRTCQETAHLSMYNVKGKFNMKQSKKVIRGMQA